MSFGEIAVSVGDEARQNSCNENTNKEHFVTIHTQYLGPDEIFQAVRPTRLRASCAFRNGMQQLA